MLRKRVFSQLMIKISQQRIARLTTIVVFLRMTFRQQGIRACLQIAWAPLMVLLGLAACGQSGVLTVTLVPPEEPVYADTPFPVMAVVYDDDHEPGELVVRWSSDRDGMLAGPSTVDAYWRVAGDVALSEGSHTLTIELEDPEGHVATDSVVVDVGGMNDVPACAFLAPEAGAQTPVGEETTIVFSVTDANVNPSSLAISMRSDVDGELVLSGVDEDGRGTLTVRLSPATHVLTLSASDETGARCSSELLHTIGSPPTVSITSPAEGYVEDIGESVLFTATVSDESDAPNELALTWSSDRSGEFPVLAADADGNAMLETFSLLRGPHRITLRATDGQGLYAEDSVSIVVNGPPDALVVSIAPSTPDASDVLAARIDTANDAEGDELSYRYEWRRDGRLMPELTDDEVPAELTASGQLWELRVFPSDGRLVGEPGEAIVTIQNGVPTVSDVMLSSMAPRTNDLLTATVSAEDVDGDEVTLAYEWSVNGMTVPMATGASLDGAMHFNKGDTVTLTVTPSDADGPGAPVTSADVTVVNSPPTMPVIAVSAQVSYGTEDIHCAIAEPSVDPDGDMIAYTASWTADGMPYPTDVVGAAGPTTRDITDDTAIAADHGLAEEFRCIVTASDGEEATDSFDAIFVTPTGPLYSAGYDREFPYTSVLARNYLLGHPITITSEMVVLELNLISKRTASNGRVALYTDVAGVPAELVVGSDSQGIRSGSNDFDVAPTRIPPGSYWLMAVYDSTAYTAENRDRNTVYYVAMSQSAPFPEVLTGLRSYSGYRHNYFLTGY